jgi:hypothetical protein
MVQTPLLDAIRAARVWYGRHTPTGNGLLDLVVPAAVAPNFPEAKDEKRREIELVGPEWAAVGTVLFNAAGEPSVLFRNRRFVTGPEAVRIAERSGWQHPLVIQLG